MTIKATQRPGWTSGEPRISYQTCKQCGERWYFWRSFCPSCGDQSPDARTSKGRGTVYAVTVVHRAPSQALAKHVPYTLILVDTDEGVRLMAHGEPGLLIGDSVQALFREFGDSLIPHFSKVSSSHE